MIHLPRCNNWCWRFHRSWGDAQVSATFSHYHLTAIYVTAEFALLKPFVEWKFAQIHAQKITLCLVMMYDAISFNILEGSGNFGWGTAPQILKQRNLDLVMFCICPGQAYRKKSFYYEWHNQAHCKLSLVENLLTAWFTHILRLARRTG